MDCRFKFRIPMFDDKGNFVSYQYLQLGDTIQYKFSHQNGKPEQCIGLLDKNLTLIYENDIVKKGNEIFIVRYQDSMACFAPQHFSKDYDTNEISYSGRVWFDDYDSASCELYRSNVFEVLGNINENPSLLNRLSYKIEEDAPKASDVEDLRLQIKSLTHKIKKEEAELQDLVTEFVLANAKKLQK